LLTTETRAISTIVIHPRQRQEYIPEEIAKLASSVRRTRGLIHPIVLDPADDSLVAGGRRTQAYLWLQDKYPDEPQWKEIPFIYKDQQDELSRQIDELEENISRLDLQWWERAAAIAKIDELQRKVAESKGETWNMRKTAEMIGVSLGTVSQSTQLVEEAKRNPEIKKKDSLVGAMRELDTQKKIEERKRDIERKTEGRIKTFPAEIIVGDALDLIKKEPDNEYDCITTNFPFGVEYGYSGQAEKLYDDEESYIVDLVRGVVKESYRVLKPDSWFFGFFDVRKATYSNPAVAFFNRVKQVLNAAVDKEAISREIWAETLEMGHKSLGLAHWFEEAGFDYVRVMPIIWAKPNKTQGNIGDPRKGLIVAYEAAILACKGDGVLLKQGRQDIFIVNTLNPNERDFGMQMPVELCAEIISMLTLGKGRVLDPFAGVGSFGEGALNNQCSFKGFELNEERAATGNLRLREHIFAQVEKAAS
jgi:DNA modification methylase